MKAKTLILLDTEYSETLNGPLDELSWHAYWDYAKTKFVRAIRLENIESVIKILGKNIELDPEDVKKIRELANRPCAELEVEPWKGKSGMDVEAFPKFFRLTEFRKVKEDGKVDKVTHEVPIEIVNEMWDYLLTRPLGTPTHSATVAENMCNRLGIDRFNRLDSGTFDWQKFFGSRGEGYFPYFYYVTKVLESYGVIAYSGRGEITRLKDVWEHQTKFETMKTEGIEE